jgi:uncharacterized membrane protein YjfL (UPF0719 family)
MNLTLIIQGLIEILISFASGIFIFFISFKVFSLLTRNIDELSELKRNNLSVAILGMSFVFGIVMLVKSAINPTMETLNFVMSYQGVTFPTIIYAIIRIIIIYIVSGIFAFLILWLAIKIFLILTSDIDEMEEIKKNNIAVSIIIATFIVSTALILQYPLKTLLNALVASPYIADSEINEHLLNMNILLEGIVELGVSLLGSIFVFFAGFKLFSLFTKKLNETNELKKNNIAVSILLSSFILSIMILTKATLIPANEYLGYVLSAERVPFIDIAIALGRIVAFFIISLFFSFILIWISMKLFIFLTHGIDEMKEIKNNNIAVAFIVAILLVSIAFLLESGLTSLLNGLIQTPDVGKGLLDISNIK